ncbi:hypothetical protein CMZ82_13090 [Lysobacteraceae bacterium NML93-0792]|nr:hypothetical protein CMZ82_13090 [Xanthomonadaceae bacterium NML93-0792]PBS14791.1 hypothetical protein CMZ81_13935 [Xanthomonadaceae bacterium NML93-0793]PBS18785.1 hypothetical protein CMZ80_10995 [Xanthomonadaceae bacterium NML93-0831]
MAAAGPLLIVAIGLLLYWPGLQGGFVFDDFPNLVHDPDWKVTSLEPSAWHRAIAHGIASGSGRPLALFSFALNHYFTGLDPFWLKLTGLVLHLLNGVLVFVLVRQLCALMPAARANAALGTFAALLMALAWTLHPLQVSSVLYVVQRMEVGAATGVLLCLIAYTRARTLQIAGLRYWPWLLVAACGLAFGLGFKETALLAPGYALLLELFAFRFRDGTRRRRVIGGVYLAGLLAAIVLFLVRILPGALAPDAYAFRDFTMAERLLTQAHVLLVYLGQIAFPRPEALLFYYDNFPVSTSLTSPPGTWIGLFVLFTLAITAWMLRRLAPLASFGILWFFVAHALSSNVVALELMFEHRNYLALLGIVLAATQLLALLALHHDRTARRIYGGLLVTGLAILCAIQVHTWAEPFRLALTLENRNPSSLRASYDLGRLMLEKAGNNRESPLVSLAFLQFEHASELPSRSPLPEQAIVIMSARYDRPVPDDVWPRIRHKIGAGAAGPEQISALHGMIECRVQGTCDLDDEQLFRTLLVALDANPNEALIRSLYSNFAWGVLGDRALAIRMMQEAVDLAPDDSRFRENLAQFKAASGAAHGHDTY